jgi:hypothetical protein
MLDELHLHAPPPRPEQYAKGRHCLALAITRVDDYEPFVDTRPSH